MFHMFAQLTDRLNKLSLNSKLQRSVTKYRYGSRAAATTKMECFLIIVKGFQPLTIITKRSILNLAAALDPPLALYLHSAIVSFIVCFHYLNTFSTVESIYGHFFIYNRILTCQFSNKKIFI